MKKRRNLNNYVMSDMYCTECGNRGLSIPRDKGSFREPGHLKALFCCTCQKTTNHAEVRGIWSSYGYNEFREEFKLGRFVNGNKRSIVELRPCGKVKCPYNKNGKCWNDIHSYKCSERDGIIEDIGQEIVYV